MTPSSKKNRHPLIPALALATLGAITGCIVHTEPRTTTTTGATMTKNDAAIDRIATARCDRAGRCQDVGAGREYATRAVCYQEMKSDTRDTLSDDCPRGVDDGRLSICIAAIKNERCDHPFDTIDRLASCRRSELCRK